MSKYEEVKNYCLESKMTLKSAMGQFKTKYFKALADFLNCKQDLILMGINIKEISPNFIECEFETIVKFNFEDIDSRDERVKALLQATKRGENEYEFKICYENHWYEFPNELNNFFELILEKFQDDFTFHSITCPFK